MISVPDGSRGSRYFLNVVNEIKCFTSCACAFNCFGLISCFECTSDKKGTYVLSSLNETNGGCKMITFSAHFAALDRKKPSSFRSPCSSIVTLPSRLVSWDGNKELKC